LRRIGKQRRTTWVSVAGTGLLCAYFLRAAMLTTTAFMSGAIIAAPVDLGVRLVLAVIVVATFPISIGDFRRGRRESTAPPVAPTEAVMKMRRLSGIVIVICCVALLGVLLYRVFGRPMRYEVPGGFKGWLVVRYEDPSCPPLGKRGI